MIPIDYDLKDIVISALRYAIGRKTYVTSEISEYIMEHPELIDIRVRDVMLRDLEEIDNYYKKDDIDYKVFDKLKQWLEKLEVKK